MVEPFDLHAPEKILLPRPGKVDRMELTLGDPGEMKLVRNSWADGTCVTQLIVPCDSLPHCHYCECGSEHLVYITDEQVEQLKRFL